MALPQMAPMEVDRRGKTRDRRAEMLPHGLRAAIKSSSRSPGRSSRFGLAVAFATLVWLVGRPVSESEATTTVGYVLPDSPAARPGSRRATRSSGRWRSRCTRFGGMGSDSITWRIVRSEGDTIPITVERTVNGVTRPSPSIPAPTIEPTKPWMRKALRRDRHRAGAAPDGRPSRARQPGG